MRKLKKINGYLVVRFNDREKREYGGTGLGNFGVIDAELYTGILDVDRMVMEYDDAETLEIALEQARGLESEMDVEEAEVAFTVVKEANEGSSEDGPFYAVDMFNAEKAVLENKIRNRQYLDVDPRTAAHELAGYVQALDDLGMVDSTDERFMVTADIFRTPVPCSISRRQEETLAYICDEVCKYREGRTQEELDAICAKCKVDRWAGAPPTLTPQEVRELRNLEGLLKEMDNYVNGGEAATPGNEVAKRTARRLEMKLPGRVTPETIQEALEAARDSDPPRETFQNAPSGVRNDYNTKKVYALGLALAGECPDNDCRVYLNIFNMARELDAALDVFSEKTAPALALRSALMDKLGELWEMYSKNYAVQQYREGMEK